MTNPKLIFKGDKIFLVDAPEKPTYNCIPKCDPKFISDCDCNKSMLEYLEALSKAPTWEVKNKVDVWDELILQVITPEQGKLYDLPKGYTYKLEECDPEECHESYCFNNSCLHPEKFALLIPQAEEVKGEICNDPIEFATWYSGMDREKVLIAYTRWKKEKSNPNL